MKRTIRLLVLVAVAFWHDWLLALIAFVAFPASVLPIIRMSRRLRGFSRKGQITLGNLTVLLQETVQGNRVVKAFGMEEYEQRRFGAENKRLFRLAMKAARIRAFTSPMVEILAAFGIAGVVWYGGSSVISGIALYTNSYVQRLLVEVHHNAVCSAGVLTSYRVVTSVVGSSEADVAELVNVGKDVTKTVVCLDDVVVVGIGVTEHVQASGGHFVGGVVYTGQYSTEVAFYTDEGVT